MAEDSKEPSPSKTNTSDAEKKTVGAVAASGAAPTQASKPPQPLAQPPKPAVAPPPRPQTTAPAAPPPAKTPPKDTRRRTFLKAMLTVGAVLSIIPFVPWGTFLSSTVESGSAKRTLLQPVMVDDVTKYGPAAGQVVNVNDTTTFPPNDHWVITYPTSGDKTIDSQNPDTFLKWELIRLPTELGGANKKATDFVAFSKVCVHLWCSPNYNPTQGTNPNENGYSPGAQKHQQYECPCHGSIYEVPDGHAVQGPASLQAAPTNAIPMLTLMADSKGVLYVMYPNADPKTTTVSNGVPALGNMDPIEADGIIGFGRDFNSYNNFLVPSGQLAADSGWAKVVVQ